MTEKDLDLKLAARRLAWRQGSATRLNVPLRAYIEKRPGRSGFQEFTDLDLLAVDLTASGRLTTQVFDCKTSSSRTTERAFWLRGVADLFSVNDAWMLRENEVAEASRQLADRLSLGILSRENLDVLTSISAPLSESAPIDRLFDPTNADRTKQLFSNLGGKLMPLGEYLRYDNWIYDSYRNLTQMVAHLEASASTLDGNSPIHVALLFDSAWIYLFTLARAAEYVRRTNASRIYETLHEYFLGGQLAIREKEVVIRATRRLTPGKEIKMVPDYFDPLAEAFARLFVRPMTFIPAMRYCEVAVASLIEGRRPSIPAAFGQDYDIVTAKLLMDVILFLAASAKLSPSFRTIAKEITLGTSPQASRDNSAAPIEGSSPAATPGSPATLTSEANGSEARAAENALSLGSELSVTGEEDDAGKNGT